MQDLRFPLHIGTLRVPPRWVRTHNREEAAKAVAEGDAMVAVFHAAGISCFCLSTYSEESCLTPNGSLVAFEINPRVEKRSPGWLHDSDLDLLRATTEHREYAARTLAQ